MNTKYKNRKWTVVSISEKKYNPYEGVQESKERPVLVWNNSNKLFGKILCFYCTSKESSHTRNFLYEINDKNNKKTYVDLSKVIFVENRDINWNKRWFNVKDKSIKVEITERINEMFIS